LLKTMALLSFDGEARNWIHRFKYPEPGLTGLDPGSLGVARMLGRAAGRAAEIRSSDWIVPVPLHPRRFRQRGFNPSALLAREVALPQANRADARWLNRVRETRPQAGLDATSRRHNVAGAFACRPRSGPVPKRVWLVDDVTTTGATLAAAAAALRAAGVREVLGLCLARTPLVRKEVL
jgi:ComF family protein